MSRLLLFLVMAWTLGLAASAIPGGAGAQVTRCTENPGYGGYTCHTTQPPPPVEDPAERIIRNMGPECRSGLDALGEMAMVFGTTSPGRNWEAAENARRVAAARRERCERLEAAARANAIEQQAAAEEAALRARQMEIYQEQEAARQRAAQEKAARDQWLATVSQVVLEGRCSDAKDMALRQGRLDVADQVQRVCVPPAPVKAQAPLSPPGPSSGKLVSIGEASTQLQLVTSKASTGDLEAQNELGFMYANGKGVPVDYAAAADWYRKAADKGFVKSQIALGELYQFGRGLAQDYTWALIWYRKAYDNSRMLPKEHSRAAQKIGYMYENGLGVTRDNSEAEYWYRIAGNF